jgi:hypothetical protein
MLMKLTVNDHASQIASVADLRQELASFASQQFQEIWLCMDAGGLMSRSLTVAGGIVTRADVQVNRVRKSDENLHRARMRH